MPHQCTTCGRTFPDGSKEMLSGCPDCGGNKFQFRPEGASTSNQPTSDPDQPTSDPDQPAAPSEPKSPDAASVDSATEAQPAESQSDDSSVSRGRSVESSPPESPPAESPSESPSVESPNEDDTEHVRERSEEDVAQASARSDVVSPEELDQASREVDTGSDPEVAGSEVPEGDRPDIGELRDELNEQFESIRIVSPGKYELNLMELYDRQEYIISLQEDGRYVIEMPDAWGISDE